MVYDVRNIVVQLENMGVLDVILPFLLIFTLVFAILQKSKILQGSGSGDEMRRYNVVIALVLALGVVIPHVTGRYRGFRSPVDIINSALPQISVLIVAIVMFLLLLGIFGAEYKIGGDTPMGGVVTLLAFGSVFFIFAVSAGWFRGRLPYWLDFLRDPQLQALVVVILVFGLIVKFITSPEDDNDDDEGPLKVIAGPLQNVNQND